jgi:hypothetical protein
VSWFKLDDQFPRHPKVLQISAETAWLFVAGGCYCAQYLTDGIIPKAAVAGLTTARKWQVCAESLVRVGLWHDRGDYYEIHDYLDYNPTREEVENVRQQARERRAKGGKRSRERRANATNPDPTRPEVLAEPTLAADKPPRPRDVIFDSLCDVTGTDPSQLTDSGRGALNRAVKELRALQASGDQIHMNANTFRRRYPNAVLTAPALVKHWASLGTGSSRAPANEAPPATPEEQARLDAEWRELGV